MKINKKLCLLAMWLVSENHGAFGMEPPTALEPHKVAAVWIVYQS
jgi:hypothetical protein